MSRAVSAHPGAAAPSACRAGAGRRVARAAQAGVRLAWALALAVATATAVAATGASAPPVSAAASPTAAAQPLDEAALRAFLRELRCVVCQNESLADSTAPLALDLKREIAARLATGETPEAVRAWLAARYGDFVSYRPPLRAATGLLWAGPAALALVGVAVVWRQARRRGAPPADGAAEDDLDGCDPERNPR